MHPHLNRQLVISDRTGDFHQSAHRLLRQEDDLTLFQLCRDPFDASPTKRKLLYTPGLRRRPRFSKTLEGVPWTPPPSRADIRCPNATIFTTLRVPMRPTSSLASSRSTCWTRANNQRPWATYSGCATILCVGLAIIPTSWLTLTAASFTRSPIPTTAFPLTSFPCTPHRHRESPRWSEALQGRSCEYSRG